MTEELYTLGLSLLGPLSKRPAASREVRLFIDKDTGIAYVSNGTSWLSTGVTFAGASADGSNGLIVAGSLAVGGTFTAGDPNAALLPADCGISGTFYINDVPGCQPDRDDTLNVNQTQPLTQNYDNSVVNINRNAIGLNGFDYTKPALLVRDQTASTAPVVQITKQGVAQFQIDGDGATFPSKIKATNHSVPTAAAGVNAGTSPPAPVLGAGANDTAGSLTFGTGTSPAIGAQVVLTFGTAYSTAPKAVIVTPTNAAAAAKGPFYATATTTTLNLGMNVAGAASQANTVYGLSYVVMQ